MYVLFALCVLSVSVSQCVSVILDAVTYSSEFVFEIHKLGGNWIKYLNLSYVVGLQDSNKLRSTSC